MAILIDGTVTNTQTTASSAASITWAKTCGAGSVLFVGVTQDISTTNPSSVTYNGVGLTFILSAITPANVSMWSLATPTTGSSVNVVVTFGATSWGTGGAISFTGTATNPVGASNGNHQTVANTTPTVNVTTTNSNAVVLNVFYLNDRSRTATQQGGATLAWNADTGALEGTRGEGAYQTTTVPGVITASWTLSGVSTWTIVAVEIVPLAVLSRSFLTALGVS